MVWRFKKRMYMPARAGQLDRKPPTTAHMSSKIPDLLHRCCHNEAWLMGKWDCEDCTKDGSGWKNPLHSAVCGIQMQPFTYVHVCVCVSDYISVYVSNTPGPLAHVLSKRFVTELLAGCAFESTGGPALKKYIRSVSTFILMKVYGYNNSSMWPQKIRPGDIVGVDERCSPSSSLPPILNSLLMCFSGRVRALSTSLGGACGLLLLTTLSIAISSPLCVCCAGFWREIEIGSCRGSWQLNSRTHQASKKNTHKLSHTWYTHFPRRPLPNSLRKA